MWMKTRPLLPQGPVSAIIAPAWQGRGRACSEGRPNQASGAQGHPRGQWFHQGGGWRAWEGKSIQASAARSSRRKPGCELYRREGSPESEVFSLIPSLVLTHCVNVAKLFLSPGLAFFLYL